MTTIKQTDLVESIAAALQYISYYHPVDYIQHLARAYEIEQSPAARDAIAQILTNSKMCAEGRRPPASLKRHRRRRAFEFPILGTRWAITSRVAPKSAARC